MLKLYINLMLISARIVNSFDWNTFGSRRISQLFPDNSDFQWDQGTENDDFKPDRERHTRKMPDYEDEFPPPKSNSVQLSESLDNHGTLESLKSEFPPGFFAAWKDFTANLVPHMRKSDLDRLDEMDEFSVFQIRQGLNPFKEEKSSEIRYDSTGQPSQVVVHRIMRRPPVRRTSSSDYEYEDYDHEGGDEDDGGSDHEVPEKKPGPFGKGKSNFKCEMTKETLSVTRTDMAFSKKCFNIFEVKCKTEMETGKDIGSKKVCNEFSETKCRTIFQTKFKTKCWLINKKKCEDDFKTVVDWVFREKCTTTFEKECSGKGYKKVCHDVPKETCKQMPEKVEKQVKTISCRKVPEKKCKDEPFFVPQKECKDFPREMCTQDPINVPKKIPTKKCFTVPIEKCVRVPRTVLKHVPKTVPKKVCVSTKPGGSSSSGGYEKREGNDKFKPSFSQYEQQPESYTKFSSPGTKFSYEQPEYSSGSESEDKLDYLLTPDPTGQMSQRKESHRAFPGFGSFGSFH